MSCKLKNTAVFTSYACKIGGRIHFSTRVRFGLFAVRQISELFGVIRSTGTGTCHCGHKKTIQIATSSIRNFLPLYLPTHLQLRKPFKAIAHQMLVPVILDM